MENIMRDLQDMKTIVNNLRHSALNNTTMVSQLAGMEQANQSVLTKYSEEIAEDMGIIGTKLNQLSTAESAAVQQLDKLAQIINNLEIKLR